MLVNRHTIYKTCPNCGAHLDPGERCDCQPERLHPLPRDGLRATCPYFRQRVDHQGCYEIECCSDRSDGPNGYTFANRGDRDDAYKRMCCEGGYCLIRGNLTCR